MTGLLGPALAVMNFPSLSLVVKLAAERRRRTTTTTIFQDRSSPLSPATTTQVQLIKALKLNRHGRRRRSAAELVRRPSSTVRVAFHMVSCLIPITAEIMGPQTPPMAFNKVNIDVPALEEVRWVASEELGDPLAAVCSFALRREAARLPNPNCKPDVAAQ
ncbi:hypothetical protein SKAU_G00261120 [Synaphobranchus kaupii]|uniref:Uncharacterized protein n=1 Tax=Synaphobranchus kaupii TaxID=118154 RepID=A0A9Q1EYH8_SYNKA|nr:hypothetical protein SKAU_G00261120 [Synaphobranchus kaupii]